MKKHYTMVSKKDYDQMKTLFNVGLSGAKVMEVTGRSYGTVKDVKHTADFNEFNTVRHSRYEVWKGKNGIVTQPKHAPLFENEAVTEKKKVADKDIVALLERIADAVELMEAHWRPTEQKKRFKFL